MVKVIQFNVDQENLLKKLVPEPLLRKIIEDQEINAVNEDGLSALHYIARAGETNLLKLLVEKGVDLNKVTNSGDSALHYASQTGHYTMIKYLLGKIDVSVTNHENQNALQTALEAGSIIAANLILNHASLTIEQIENQDIYGRSALDIIAEKKLEDYFPKLGHIDFKENPNYNKPFIDISQAVINNKLHKYLSLHGRNSNELLDENGSCNGWSFLYQIYINSGKEEVFIKLLEFINSWDEKTESLNNMEIPTELKRNHHSAQEIFEQIINDLIVFHHDYTTSQELGLGYKQKWRHKQFELVKNKHDTRQLETILHFPSRDITQEQLAEIIKYASQKPGSFIDLGGGNHSVSISILPDRKFKYYDSNARGMMHIFDTPEELASAIFNKKYRLLNRVDKDGKFEVRMGIYQFNPKVKTEINHSNTAFESNYTKQNVLNFSELHYAVLNNAKEQIEKIILEGKISINEQDAFGYTPLYWAISLNKPELIELLIKNGADCDQVDNLKESPLIYAIKCNHIEAVAALIKLGANINYKDNMGYTPLNHAARNGCYDIVNLLCNNPNIQLDEPDNEGKTPLMNAVERGYHLVVKKLLKKDVNINLADKKQKTVFEHIDQMSIKRTAPLLINAASNDRKISLLFSSVENGDINLFHELINSGISTNIKDDNGLTPLIYASYFGHTEMVKALIPLTKNINEFVEQDGTTALTAAASAGNYKIVKHLIEAGANPFHINSEKKTALMLAQEGNHNDVVDFLKSCKRDSKPKA